MRRFRLGRVRDDLPSPGAFPVSAHGGTHLLDQAVLWHGGGFAAAAPNPAKAWPRSSQAKTMPLGTRSVARKWRACDTRNEGDDNAVFLTR